MDRTGWRLGDPHPRMPAHGGPKGYNSLMFLLAIPIIPRTKTTTIPFFSFFFFLLRFMDIDIPHLLEAIAPPACPIHDGVVLCLEGKCGVLSGRGAEGRLTCALTGTRSVVISAQTHTQKVRTRLV